MLNVAYSSDENFAPYLGVSIFSLLKYNKDDFNEINLYILDNGIKEESKEKLIKLCDAYNAKIFFIYVGNIENKLEVSINIEDSPSSVYARLFLSSLLEDIDKVLYLDADSLIQGSLKEIWELDIDNYYYAGVLDVIPPIYKLNSMIEGKIDDVYINTGFLLINLKRWRENKVEEKFIKFINKHKGKFLHADQSILNGVFKSNVKIIEPKYNVLQPFYDLKYQDLVKWVGFDYYTKDDIKEAIKNPIFIHFAISINGRPWFKGNTNHKFYYKYKNYANLSPFKNIYIEENINYKMKIIGFLMKNFPMRFVSFVYNIYLRIIS
ncbi:MAG: glycosyltransferase family 8 protein [Methanobrevibacter sp.]|jgi:lipopolysaccharide biosynthesis glycosyltransferase|nr:glycosyltransferase family 8 protein [Candidatus Methanoflexus mossambicus]